MAASETAYKSILQGVSQQIPKLRLEGQVSLQENMLSDGVTNLRRRAGAEFQYTLPFPGEVTDSIKAWDTDIAGQRMHILLGTNTGTVKLLKQDYSLAASLQNNYLKAPKPSAIRATTIGNDFFMLNVGIMPKAGAPTTGISPTRRGFFFAKAGAFSKSYVVTVTTNLGTYTMSYTTPTGQNPGDPANSTPESIADHLNTSVADEVKLAAGVNVSVRQDAFVYIAGTAAVTSLAVQSGSGTVYVQCSQASRVRLESDLPQILPAQGDGYIVAVGEQRLYKYYMYKAATTEWLESGIFGSPVDLRKMPIILKYNATANTWSFDTTPFEGRLAGDEDTNPLPEFLVRGFSGMGSFQSRLVLLGGSKVYLSSSANSKRFMRSTVTGLLDADPIAVGASANTSAQYEYAIPFQKDLMLFSEKYQALIPSGGQAITPRTATVLVTSSYSADTNSEPVAVGRTLLFPAPRSTDYFGFMEMVSSQLSDGQYVSNDATAHLPKYMGGRCRFGVASSVSSLVLFGPSEDKNSVIVYEYLWSGDEKIQQAWHTWKLKYPVATAYFSNESVHLVFIQNGVLVGASVDPKQGVLSFANERRPFSDLYVPIDVVDNKGVLPAWMPQFDPTIGESIVLAVSTGPQAGENVGIKSYDPATRTFTTVRSYPAGRVTCGVPYRSAFSPTPPILVDRNGVKIEGTKLTVLKWGVNTQNSSEYKVEVSDVASEGDPDDITASTLYYSSTELSPGQARVSATSRATIPARTDADTTTLLLYTEGTGELNITGLDYIGRSNQKIRRR